MLNEDEEEDEENKEDEEDNKEEPKAGDYSSKELI